MYSSTIDFIDSGLSKLTAGEQIPLQAIFATYNAVDGYGDGPVESGKHGLNINIQAGYYIADINDIIMLGASIEGEAPKCIGRSAAQHIRDESSAAQHNVCVNVNSLDILQQANIFALVYAGFSAFQEALDCAAHIKKENNDATVIILTCDCDIDRKSKILDEYVDSDNITDYVVTHMCGGRGDMSEILEALIKQWPGVTA